MNTELLMYQARGELVNAIVKDLGRVNVLLNTYKLLEMPETQITRINLRNIKELLHDALRSVENLEE